MRLLMAWQAGCLCEYMPRCNCLHGRGLLAQVQAVTWHKPAHSDTAHAHTVTQHARAQTQPCPARPACAGDSDEDMSPAASSGDLPAAALGRRGSFPSLNQAIRAMTKFGMSTTNLAALDTPGTGASPRSPAPSTNGGWRATAAMARSHCISCLPACCSCWGRVCADAALQCALRWLRITTAAYRTS